MRFTSPRLSPLLSTWLLAASTFFSSLINPLSGAEIDSARQSGEASTTVSRCIPIESIWSNGSVGKNILRRLEPDLLVYRDSPENIKTLNSPDALKLQREKAKKSLVLQIEKALRKLPPASPKVTPAPGFVVRGTGREALPGIVDALVKEEKSEDKFKAKDELSLVFFSYPAQPGVGIESVEIRDSSINVTFFLTSHGLPTINPTLYLIPLGKLPPGTYEVDLLRSAKEGDQNQAGFPPVDSGVEKYTVCKPFKFTVGD